MNDAVPATVHNSESPWCRGEEGRAHITEDQPTVNGVRQICKNCKTLCGLRLWKSSDISDQEIFELINRGQVHLSTIQVFFHSTRQIPPKVTQAKLAQMVNKGRLLGCACGCRGDFEIPKCSK